MVRSRLARRLLPPSRKCSGGRSARGHPLVCGQTLPSHTRLPKASIPRPGGAKKADGQFAPDQNEQKEHGGQRDEAGEGHVLELGAVIDVLGPKLGLAAEDELALITVVPHTTALRGNRWESISPKPFLKPGAFHFQQIQSPSIFLAPEYLTALEGEYKLMYCLY